MTEQRIDQLYGQNVRAWIGPTLVLIGGRVRVQPHEPGYVKVTSDVPSGAGCVLPADTPAHLETSGAWTVTIRSQD